MKEKKIALVLSFLVLLWCMITNQFLSPVYQMVNVFIIGNLLILNAMMSKEIWRPSCTPLWVDNL